MSIDRPPSYIRLPVVQGQVALSKSSIYEMITGGQFPPPHRLGARAVGWLQSEVTEWVVARSKQPSITKAPRPIALRREARAKRAAVSQPKK